MPMNPRLLVPRATGGFDPSRLANLELWLDAAKTSSVTLNGSNVSEWRDARPSGAFFVTQSSAGQQPAWIASSKNGLPGINFAAGKNLPTPTTPAFNFNQPTTYFVVFQSPTSSGGWGLFDGLTTRQHVFGNNETQLIMFAGASATATTIVAATFYAAIFIYNGSASSHRLNTTTATTTNPSTNAINRLQIGSGTGVRGDINEFGMFSRAITDVEANALLNYLGKKWAITIT